MKRASIDKLITEVLAIEAREAQEAGALGFMGRSLIQATMPHKKTDTNEFIRNNGDFTLSILAPSRVGLPYGSIPRLLLAWITTEAVKTKEREIILGRSLSNFMSKLGLTATGGRWGSINRLKIQSNKLFCSTISCVYRNKDSGAGLNMHVADKYQLWWEPQNPNQIALWESKIELSEPFFNEITDNPIPLDLDVLKILKQSPLALDIYCWITYRISYIRKKTIIPWIALQAQFGSNYSYTQQGLRDFKKAFLRELKKVHMFYPEANLDMNSQSLILNPSNLHIRKKLKT